MTRYKSKKSGLAAMIMNRCKSEKSGLAAMIMTRCKSEKSGLAAMIMNRCKSGKSGLDAMIMNMCMSEKSGLAAMIMTRVNAIPYQFDGQPLQEPKDKVPWIEHNGVTMRDSQFIIQYIEKEFKVEHVNTTFLITG
ncbi:hypothetical protein MAR_032305 [Mya arenaria]|uniref:Thioredoxin-like fold domain-containing protein n=1 Tax=Mya arenaria TaxID=6604 RepID=A0ABY7FEM7_MYAAR|nr:hypothetical protein MAR_032305 [Mya arenaria]